MGRKSLSLIHPNPDEVIEITFGKLQKRKSHQSSNLLIDNDMHVDICETIYVAIKRFCAINDPELEKSWWSQYFCARIF